MSEKKKLTVDFSLLQELKEDILSHIGDPLSVKIDGMIVSQSFTVIHLNTGEVGLAMNYGLVYLGRDKMREKEVYLRELTTADPLLLDAVWNFDREIPAFLRTSLQTSILSALSKGLLRKGTNYVQKINSGLSLERIAIPGDSVCVIGLGGYLEAALRVPEVKRVYLADFYVDDEDSQKELEELRKRYPDTELEISNGSDNARILSRSSIACVTASSLANGTLNGILEATKGCRTVILQGISGHVFPRVLFSQGVHYVTTSEYGPGSWQKMEDWHTIHPNGNFSDFLDQNFREKVTYHP